MINEKDARVTIVKKGAVVRRSKNLRGIIEYWRETDISSVTIIRCGTGAIVKIWFADMAFCCTDFADFRVAHEWFKSRIERRGSAAKLEGVP